jgi:hypothetical protein
VNGNEIENCEMIAHEGNPELYQHCVATRSWTWEAGTFAAACAFDACVFEPETESNDPPRKELNSGGLPLTYKAEPSRSETLLRKLLRF